MKETMQHITAESLHGKLNSERSPVVIYALAQKSYVAKHIPGSINIPTENIELTQRVVPDMEQDIVVYCANADCDASPKAADALLEMGYKNVWDFEEGLAGWKRAGYPLSGQDTA